MGESEEICRRSWCLVHPFTCSLVHSSHRHINQERYLPTPTSLYDLAHDHYMQPRMNLRADFDKIELQLVRVLHTVISEQSVSKAALRLHSTQPAVSAQLRRLHRAAR